MKKRNQIIAMLLSLTMVFGLCGSEMAVWTVSAQELQENTDIDTENPQQPETQEEKADEETVTDDIEPAEDEEDKEVKEDKAATGGKKEEQLQEKNVQEEPAKGGISEDVQIQSVEDEPESTLRVSGLINDVYEYSEEEVFDEGDTVKMEVEAESDFAGAKITYEWYKAKNDTYSLADAVKLDEKSAVYSIKKSGAEKEYYICRVSDGNETEDVTFGIIRNLWQVTQYINGEADADWGEYAFGSKVKMEVKVEDVPEGYQVSYQWEDEEDDIAGATENAYEVTLNSTGGSSHEYICRVNLMKGTETIQSKECRFELDIRKTLNIESSIYVDGKEYFDSYADVYKGTEVTLKIAAESSYNAGGIRYTWYTYNSDTEESVKLPAFTGNECKVVKDGTEYQEIYCEVTDGRSTGKEEFEIGRKSKIKGSRWIDGKQTGYADLTGPECELKVKISSKPEGAAYEYVWEKGVDGSDYDFEIISGFTSNVCKVVGKDTEDSIYRCTVKDGDDEKHFEFKLYKASLMTRCFVDQQEIDGEWKSEDDEEREGIQSGEQVTLSIRAESSYNNAITYKWYKDEEEEKGVLGRSSSLSVKKGTEWIEDYYCEVSDGFQTKNLYFCLAKKDLDAIEGVALIDGKNSTSNRRYDASVKAVCGQTYHLTLELPAPESGSYQYTWGPYNESIGMLQRLSTAPDCKVQAGAEDMYDADYYACRVKDGKKERMFSFYLEADSLQLEQKINGKAGKEIYLEHGQDAVLTVDAQSSYASENITYTWQMGPLGGVEGSAKGNQYTVKKYGGYEQQYICKISDGYTTEWVTFHLYSDTLDEPVCTIDGQEVDKLQCAPGTKHTMEINIKSKIEDDELRYEWTRIDKNGKDTYMSDFRDKNRITFLRRDDVEAYSCEISNGRARKTVYFNFSAEGAVCDHDFQTKITKATLSSDGSIVSRCIKCGEVEFSIAIPYPKTINLSSEVFTYNGNVQTPTVSVIDSDGNVIDASNYTVSYSAGSMAAGTYKATITFKGNYSGSIDKTYTITNPVSAANPAPAAGTVLKSSGSNVSYKVVSAGNSVEYMGAPNKKVKSASVPATVTINNITYKVTSIAPNAFKNCKKLKKVTIGANIQTVGKQAFSGCKSLKTVTVKSKSITKIGSKAFKGINKKAKIKVPKAKLKAYKKLFKKGGVAKSVKIKK